MSVMEKPLPTAETDPTERYVNRAWRHKALAAQLLTEVRFKVSPQEPRAYVRERLEGFLDYDHADVLWHFDRLREEGN